MLILNSYEGVSDEARLLKKKLRQAGVKVSISQSPAGATDTNVVINWSGGSKTFDDLDLYSIVFNYSKAISVISNRLSFLMAVGVGDNVVDWTTLPMVASQWATGHNCIVCHHEPKQNRRPHVTLWCQDLGIPMPVVPLYTRYTNRTAEYRVHIVRDWGNNERRVMFVERKIFAPTPHNPYPKNTVFRNSKYGFYWMKNLIAHPVPQEALDAATKAAQEGFPYIHFCAIDVLYHADKKQAWVLKGTAAPELFGSVADAYTNYFVRNYRHIMERHHGTALHSETRVHPQDTAPPG